MQAGEHHLLALAAGEGQARHALAEAQCGLEGFRQALGDVGAHLEAVHHGLDVVLAARVQRRHGIQLVHRAIDAHAHETLRAQFGDHLVVLALAGRHQRRQQHAVLALRQLQHLVHHLAHRLRGEVDAVVGAARDAGAGVQQAQVVVDFCDRAHGGARVVAGGLLLDRDGRRQALDGVDVGFVHHRQELPGIGRQRLHVAALALGIEGVEGQRGLARARQAGDDDQPVTRQVDIDVGQVVGAGAADADQIHEGPVQGKRLL
jgi:hypothetical protein